MLQGADRGFPGGSVVKNPLVNKGNANSVPESGRSPGEENGNSLQYSCLGNLMKRGAWQAIVHGNNRGLGVECHLNKDHNSSPEIIKKCIFIIIHDKPFMLKY